MPRAHRGQQTGNTIIGRRWDLDYVIETGKWSLLVLDEDDLEKVPHIADLKEQENGTLVVWQNLDRLLMGEVDYEKSLGRKMDDVRRIWGLFFTDIYPAKQASNGWKFFSTV